MNRIQFWTLTGLAGLVVVLLLTQVLLNYKVAQYQQIASVAQNTINQGGMSKEMMQRLAQRIASDSQQHSDAALKELLARQQITITANTNSDANPAAPAR